MKHKLQLFDVHCEGEVGRVAIADPLEIPGNTLGEKLHHINHVDDSVRRTITLEPRSAPAGSTNLLFAPTDKNADAGFIVLQPNQAHAMSGSNAICVVTALLESGRVVMSEPETIVTLETVAGLVRTTAHCENGKCKSVRVNMTPAFVESLDLPLETPDWGNIKIDICFGGVFYALVDVQQIGLSIEPQQALELARAGMKIKSLITERIQVQHPQIPEISDLANVMFRSMDADGATRTCTTLYPGRVDRSPCGTGSAANLATLHARGRAQPGDELLSRSIIGSEFKVNFRAVTTVANRDAVLASITGRAWLYGKHEMFVDPEDPFPQGFALGDVWGPMAGEI